MLIHRLWGDRSQAQQRRLTTRKREAHLQQVQRAAQQQAARRPITQPFIYPQRVMVAGIAMIAGATSTVALMNAPLFSDLFSSRGHMAGEQLLRDRYVDGILPYREEISEPLASSEDQAESLIESPSPRASSRRSHRLPAPQSVAPGTVIWVDGDSSLVRLSQLLRYEFKHRFPGTDVQVASNGTAAALRSVLDGSIDVAAIGRRLTRDEKAKGLVAVPMARHKIAVLIGSDNLFSGSLTNYQLADILRGTITNWSEVGGPDLPLRLIDRAPNSATRQALLNYPIFADVAEKMPKSVVRQPGDRLSDIAENLGNDGITYALIDQVSDDITTPNIINREGVKIVALHQVLPDDPRYSISQPMVYVYRGDKPTAKAKAFLGYATILRRRGLLADGASLNAKRSWFETPAFGWSLLATGGILVLGFSQLRRLDHSTQLPQWSPALSQASLDAVAAFELDEEKAGDYLILDALEGAPIGVRWHFQPRILAGLQPVAGQQLHLRLYDFQPGEISPAHSDYRRRPFRQYECTGEAGALALIQAQRGHRYLAEIGYLTADDRWLPQVTSTLILTEMSTTTFLEKALEEGSNQPARTTTAIARAARAIAAESQRSSHPAISSSKFT